MQKVSTFLVAFTCLTTVYSQEYFKYYGGKKQYLNVSPNKVLVHFAENTEIDSVKSIAAKNTFYQVSDVSRTAYKELKVVSLQGTDTAATRGLIKQWKNKEQILYSGPVFINQDGEDIAALSNRLIVRLKQESDTVILQNALVPYEIDSVWQGRFDSKNYLISLSYFSEKNAMQVANELHETGLFAFSEPDLIRFLKFSGETEVIPNSTYFPYQWAHKNTGQYDGIPGTDLKTTYAWSVATGKNVTVAVWENENLFETILHNNNKPEALNIKINN